MHNSPDVGARRARILRVACALVLAATAAACDKCGDFPIRFQVAEPDACRDEGPRQR